MLRRRPRRWTRWPTARWPSSSRHRPTSPARPTRRSSSGEGVPASYLEYLELLEAVFAECVRKLEPGGRIAVNVANLGRKPYRSLSADVIRILQDHLGLLLRGELVWQKGEGASGSCAWGSFRSAANPVLRDITERVVVASKGRFDRARTVKQRQAAGLPPTSTLDDRGVHGPHPRRVGDPAGERPAGRPPGPVPRRAARAAHPPLHLRGRPRARPVHGQRLGRSWPPPGSAAATSATTPTPTTSTSPGAGWPRRWRRTTSTTTPSLRAAARARGQGGAGTGRGRARRRRLHRRRPQRPGPEDRPGREPRGRRRRGRPLALRRGRALHQPPRRPRADRGGVALARPGRRPAGPGAGDAGRAAHHRAPPPPERGRHRPAGGRSGRGVRRRRRPLRRGAGPVAGLRQGRPHRGARAGVLDRPPT